MERNLPWFHQLNVNRPQPDDLLPAPPEPGGHSRDSAARTLPPRDSQDRVRARHWRSVKSAWDAIKKVRAENPKPAQRFPGDAPKAGTVAAAPIEAILGQKGEAQAGVVKVTIGREGTMHGLKIGGSMGLITWAAFSG